MILDAYIGWLDDPDFHWEGGDWNSNVPKRRSPFFPNGHAALAAITAAIEAGTIDGKQTDWAGFVARVTKAELTDFVKAMGVTGDRAGAMNQTILDFIATLEDKKPYGLVAVEGVGDSSELFDD